jgi:hypothetical protein
MRRFYLRMLTLAEERHQFIFDTVYANRTIDQGISGCAGTDLYNLRAPAETELLKVTGIIDSSKGNSSVGTYRGSREGTC